MDNPSKNKDIIILKRNQKEEENNNYTKIYDLSLIDSIKDITPEEKFNILCTIKKIILCTNNYMDSVLDLEIFGYLSIIILTFILYYLILLPIFKYFIFSEQQNEFINTNKQFNFLKKLKIYLECHIPDILFSIGENLYIRYYIKKVYLYYAKHELERIKNDFIIKINETNYDLAIKRNKNKSYSINENKTENDFYQYVICFPNLKNFDGEVSKILNEDEITILQWAYFNKRNMTVYLIYFRIMFIVRSIIIPIYYIISFYFLTLIRIKKYCIAKLIYMLILGLMRFYYDSTMPIKLKLSDYVVNKKNIKKGYILNTETYVIEVFKLKESYKDDDDENFDKFYIKHIKLIDVIHNKFENPLIKYFFN